MEVKRATFEQVYNAQLEFIFGDTGLDALAVAGETVDPKSRRVYFENLALALVGKGLHYDVTLEYGGNCYNLGSVSTWARRMAYFTDTPDHCQELMLKGKKVRVPFRDLWVSLRESLYQPIDDALTMALQCSAEMVSNPGGSYEFNPETSQPE